MTPGEPIREHYRQQGRQQEQQRIIELLQKHLEPCDCGITCEYFQAGFQEAITLIKEKTE
jgi:hypothetical protein